MSPTPLAARGARPRTYRIFTLGCKLNQFDSAVIVSQLRARGFQEAGEGSQAGVVVVNTCTVTGAADREARRAVRRLRRESPDCRMLVTGCYAELDRERLAAMAGVDAVVGHSDRERLPAVLDRLTAGCEPTQGEISCIDAAGPAAGPFFGDRTRAFLRVQEGCDLRCSYCVIPRVRGPSRSTPPEAVGAALAELIARGYREIVLTGVNTGDYGKDLTPRTDLSALLRRLLAAPGLGRLRLNSLEPRTVTAEIIALLAGEGRLARHLQIPLQSGSDSVLGRMRRNYRTREYASVLETLRRKVPDIGLGADVIVGFPQESEREFEEGLRFIEASPLNYLHVFSYSDRPGTPASALDGHVLLTVTRERSARLRSVGSVLGFRFRRGFVGRTLPALVLHERRPDGRLRALSDNFIELGLEAAGSLANRIVSARILDATLDDTLAAPADPAEAA